MSRLGRAISHILDGIAKIEKYSKKREAFLQEELIQTWVVYHLQIIEKQPGAFRNGSGSERIKCPGER